MKLWWCGWLAWAAVTAHAQTPSPPLTVHAQGLSSFQLGVTLQAAAQHMAKFDRAALQIGPGCDARDQSVVTATVAGMSATVMAMADERSQIVEVVASVPHQGAAVTQLVCKARAQDWVHALSPRLGMAHSLASYTRGNASVSQTWLSPQSKVEARWFAGGGSCDLSLHFQHPRQSPL
jgi:hypothetical protein